MLTNCQVAGDSPIGRSVVNKAQNNVNTLKDITALNETSDMLKMTVAWLPCYNGTSIVVPQWTRHFYLDAGHVAVARSKQAKLGFLFVFRLAKRRA
jgi:hypothetical protein